jgi:cold shock CspA family protein
VNWPVPSRSERGSVASFDPERGVGTLRSADGAELFFHCTAIADGSRQIEVGTAVTFVIEPGHRGLIEARRLERC